MRTNLRRMIVGVLVLVLAMGAAMVARNLWQQRKMDLALEVIELLPEVAQQIENFHRVKIDGDRKVWEVSAERARYFEEDGVVAVEGPVIGVFPEEGPQVSMRGRSGKVYLDGRDLERVEVEGAIEVEIDQYSVRTEFARYEAASDVIDAPGVVTVESEQVRIDGEGMEVDLGAERLRVAEKVRMVLWPAG